MVWENERSNIESFILLLHSREDFSKEVAARGRFYFLGSVTQGVLPTFHYGGPMSRSFADPQILSHSFDEPQTMSFIILRP